jgi:hypothetical protein
MSNSIAQSRNLHFGEILQNIFDGWKRQVESTLNGITSFFCSKSKCQNFKMWKSKKHGVIKKHYYYNIFTKQLYNLHEKIISYLFPPIKPPISTIKSGVPFQNIVPMWYLSSFWVNARLSVSLLWQNDVFFLGIIYSNAYDN